ncbi:hypothetical protein RRSWK_06575 [Rhodopirellula sp. SWK7]|nr:hypothetical protein RRSWK_06575 [Rhodopirellula sp. SWK7]
MSRTRSNRARNAIGNAAVRTGMIDRKTGPSRATYRVKTRDAPG